MLPFPPPVCGHHRLLVLRRHGRAGIERDPADGIARAARIGASGPRRETVPTLSVRRSQLIHSPGGTGYRSRRGLQLHRRSPIYGHFYLYSAARVARIDRQGEFCMQHGNRRTTACCHQHTDCGRGDCQNDPAHLGVNELAK